MKLSKFAVLAGAIIAALCASCRSSSGQGARVVWEIPGEGVVAVKEGGRLWIASDFAATGQGSLACGWSAVDKEVYIVFPAASGVGFEIAFVSTNMAIEVSPEGDGAIRVQSAFGQAFTMFRVCGRDG